MRQGKATNVAPQSLLLTTQETADSLGVSRPKLVKLLEDVAPVSTPCERFRQQHVYKGGAPSAVCLRFVDGKHTDPEPTPSDGDDGAPSEVGLDAGDVGQEEDRLTTRR